MKSDYQKKSDSFMESVKEFFKDIQYMIRGNRKKTKIRCAQILDYFSNVDTQTTFEPESCIDSLLLWIEFMKKSKFKFAGLQESDMKYPPVVSDVVAKRNCEVMHKALRKDVLSILNGGYSYIRSWDDDIRNFGVYTNNVQCTYYNYINGLIKLYEKLSSIQHEGEDEIGLRETEIESQCASIAEARAALEEHFSTYRSAIDQMEKWSSLTIFLSFLRKE